MASCFRCNRPREIPVEIKEYCTGDVAGLIDSPSGIRITKIKTAVNNDTFRIVETLQQILRNHENAIFGHQT